MKMFWGKKEVTGEQEEGGGCNGKLRYGRCDQI